jgi:type I restriction-modification system DNA methylase subunit
MYLNFEEYPQRWDEIANIFSRQAILKGSFDRYAEGVKGKRGTGEVDDAFLGEIERWRELLARNLALRNPGLSQRELNYAVQMTIDRLIFLRICEDRGIEFYGQLQALLNGPQVYPRLVQLFHKADERYNSGLFHFQHEKEQSDSPDQLTPSLAIDDKPLKDILGNLYYPDSPYEFSVLPADILGQVYEQFLGKVIRLTPGHQAKVEDKPEVKKAGGVFYTPTYIVEYIVRHTLGALLEAKQPGEKGAGKGEPLRVLDPACGSGSFLLGAYQYLLDWYRDGYIAQGPEKHAKGSAPRLVQVALRGGAEWRLTTSERKRILLDHIYGVDIDPQAVEVTKLSLLLKVLEGESEQSLAQQLSLWRQRALPHLGRNIQCGNSLIGEDFYHGQQSSFLDSEEQQRVNAFDWPSAFPQAMAAGGFDVVIGNPPYIRIQALKEWAPKEVEFYKQRYVSASKGNYDIYVVFVEKGLSLLNPRGRLGFILPHKFFNAQYGQPLRQLLSQGRHLSKVVHFGDQQVFERATTYTCLMFLEKVGSDEFEVEKVTNLDTWRIGEGSISDYLQSTKALQAEWNFVIGQDAILFNKLSAMSPKLGELAEKIAQGIRTSANEVFVLDQVSEDEEFIIAHSQQLNQNVKLNRTYLSKFLLGRNIKRYRILDSKKIVIIPYRVENNKTVLINNLEFTRNCSSTYAYLHMNKKFLENREHGKMKGQNWYGFIYPKNIELMSTAKILVPDIADRAQFSIDENGEFAYTSGYGITLKDQIQISIKYVLGIVNSRLLNYFIRQISTPLQNGFFRYFSQYIEQLPIRPIDFTNPADLTRHDQMVGLVERMLALHKELAAAKTPNDHKLLQRQIELTDRQIDALVYELYELTAEEIAVVESR